MTVDVLTNDADADSDPLTVTSTTDPANGTTTINADNTITGGGTFIRLFDRRVDMDADGSGHRRNPAGIRAAGEISGTIYIRVVDSDQSRNEANVDAVRVDEMYRSAAP